MDGDWGSFLLFLRRLIMFCFCNSGTGALDDY